MEPEPPAKEVAGERPTRGFPSSGLSRRRQLTGLGLAVVLLLALTTGLTPVRESVAAESSLLVYLLAVVVVAVVGGWWPAVLSALAGFLLVNWFLTPPYATWQVGEPAALVELVVFVLVALVVSLVVEIGTRDRARAARNEAQLARAADHARQLAETDRVRSALLAAVGHDLRTPLASIKASASGLRQEDVAWTPAAQRELLGGIEESADHLSSLVENLLDMSRIRAGAVSVLPQAVSLEEVVYRALLRHREGRVRVDIPEGAVVLADPVLLERVVANLVDNSVRLSPEGEVVVVRAESVREKDGRPQVLLHIVDRGPGVEPAAWDELFEPFQRLGDSSPEGVGLGLAIAKGFLDAMGGTVRPTRTPGGGLTMTVILPGSA